MIGLVLTGIGHGGIRPCINAFGGDQFKLPEQARQLQTFFSVFYFSINAGSLISTILTPVLREVTDTRDFMNYRLGSTVSKLGDEFETLQIYAKGHFLTFESETWFSIDFI